ncbi:MAG TPA: class I SAM-dependent methyltransferase, partial [Phycisphaerales bacterium]|nr:class I SAM-dependent methyltransferase [Phycisphaerales bacterium]
MRHPRLNTIAPLCLLAALLVCPTAQAQKRQAERILDATGVRGGLIVHVGCGNGELTAALLANDSYLVHGLATDAANVARAREYVSSKNLYGRVTISRLTCNRLPYVDNLVNLVVAEDLGGISTGEVMRVLAPNGVAYIRNGGQWEKTVKGRPDNIAEWTHYLNDAGGNAVAGDSVVGPPRHMQWTAEPVWSRNHHTLASISGVVSANGRIFYIVDQGPPASMEVAPTWSLTARDAFNGVFLWKRSI